MALGIGAIPGIGFAGAVGPERVELARRDMEGVGSLLPHSFQSFSSKAGGFPCGGFPGRMEGTRGIYPAGPGLLQQIEDLCESLEVPRESTREETKLLAAGRGVSS